MRYLKISTLGKGWHDKLREPDISYNADFAGENTELKPKIRISGTYLLECQ